MKRREWCSLLVALCLSGCGIGLPDFPPVIPPPVPVNPGAKVALILHDSQQQTPEFSRMKTDLQTESDAATYIASKGHRMLVLPIDSTDNDGKPLPTIERLKPDIQDKALPVLVIGPKGTDGKLGKPQSIESLPNSAVANDVVAAIKKAGG